MNKTNIRIGGAITIELFHQRALLRSVKFPAGAPRQILLKCGDPR
jgi:hypothetical protein